MAKRLIVEVVHFIYCCMVFLEISLGNSLNEECVKKYSASYKRQASQTYGLNEQHVASHAVDGNDETCSKTIRTTGTLPWWQVDLTKKINISYIQVTNSERHPTSIRVYVRYDVGSEGKACGKYVLAGGETRVLRCKPVLGRSVRIVGTKENDSLSLCEVQVFDDTVQLNEGVMYDVWFNTTDRSYGFINTDASSQGIVPSFDAPKDILDYYGVRMKTYYNAPESGMYIFNMTGDNQCKLFIRDTSTDEHAKVIGRIPREEGLNDWTRYTFWNEAFSEPYYLTKDNVYELTALMLEKEKNDHLRVGVTFPNGTFVGPIKNRIFITEEAARSLTKNCHSRSIAGSTRIPKTATTKAAPLPTSGNTEVKISRTVDRLLSDKTYSHSKFELLADLERLGYEKAEKLSLTNKPFASYVVQNNTFVFAAVSLNLNTSYGFNFPGSLQYFSSFPDQASISFPEKAFPAGTGRISAVFMIFKTPKEMSDKTGNKHNRLTSYVLSASMTIEVWNDVYKSFTLVFRTIELSITKERHCVYWIEDEQLKSDGDFGRWSKSGCSLVYKNETHTTCECNRLAKFTILFRVPEEDKIRLEMITYVGLSLSSMGCFITFIVYLRTTRTLKTIVHLNLVLALGLENLIFLFRNLSENNKDVCFASTILTFYLNLAVFAWMLIEGLHLYFLVIRVYGGNDNWLKQYYHIFGWGGPAVVVSITAGIFQYDLMSEHHCLLSRKPSLIWLFISSVLLVTLVNTLILAAVLRKTKTFLRNQKEESAIRTLAMLVLILGTTWVLGIVSFANNSIILQYIVAACDAFQGFFIFILFMVPRSITNIRDEKRLGKPTDTE